MVLTLIALCILKNPCIPGIDPTWSWCMILLMCSWILSANILLRIFVSYVHQWSDQIRSDQSLSCVQLSATPWIAARQASLSITNSRSSLRLTSIESVMPSSHLILCLPLLLLPPIPPSIRVFSNESTLHMRWYWSVIFFFHDIFVWFLVSG